MIELIHENVHFGGIRGDLDTLAIDAELLENLLGGADPSNKAHEITITLTARLHKHAGNPRYHALAERLEDLKNRHEHVNLASIDFLKELLELAKDIVRTERGVKQALCKTLFK